MEIEGRKPRRPWVLWACFLVGSYLAVFAALQVFAWGYEAWAGFWQDRCSFGSVSNERYREWLARARAMRRAQGPLLTQTYAPDPTSGRLRNANDLRFAELSKDARSFEDRIAAAHAMLRAEGMILQSIFPDKADPYSASETVVAFRYERFSTLGLFLLCVTNCKDRAAVSFYRVGDPGEPPLTELRGREEDWPSHRKLPNRTSWSFTPGPELKTPFLDPAPPRHPHPCPPTPSPEWLGLLPMSEIP